MAPALVFCCEFSKTFKNTCFTEYLRVTSSKVYFNDLFHGIFKILTAVLGKLPPNFPPGQFSGHPHSTVLKMKCSTVLVNINESAIFFRLFYIKFHAFESDIHVDKTDFQTMLRCTVIDYCVNTSKQGLFLNQ